MPLWLNLPNLVTALRIVLTPVVIRDVLAGEYRRALAVFFFAGITDLLDGIAARRMGSSTQAGAYLDPIADKILMSGAFIALAVANTVPVWFVCLVFLRDIGILAGVGVIMLLTGERKFPPSLWGKWSTGLQIAAALSWMVRNAFPGPFPDAASTALLWISAALTAISGLHYAWSGAHRLRAH
jgi:cardiolipin synthase (CMP-forming)